ncbi:DNA-binding transcriptional regulator, LacI/PurR family [Arthrobacter alpinus]|uniref:DNA-binding transcriptional regulator, LacI/PurR family n=1 Tax=Arthrobacter alpinus TaxID=656366 RepID=A0A1H5L195_9MICC|nr:LacI family DNA-binding transcriptional regulator [Arthrobacter alpinus]SEE70744.1 DNA-binding transcriptional regulator, LacI/PurR family [Arthrobacter alpinus]
MPPPPTDQHRAPVMEDVARRAGVSHQTVSRVLNDSPSVSPKTREKVRQAILELGYRRNTAARALVTRRSQTIGLLANGMNEYGPSNILLAVQEAAREAGYFVSIAGIREISQEGIAESLQRFLDQGVDGIVVQVPHADIPAMLQELNLGVPVVIVGTAADGRLSGVMVDQEKGARDAVQHLVDLGHTRIAHVAGPDRFIDSAARVAGWRHVLAQAGLEEGPLITGDWTAASGYLAGLELARRSDASAVFAANDQMAVGLLRAFTEQGIRVPFDMSLVGVDDLPEGAYLVPPLTTVRQGFQELGLRCLEIMVSQLETASPAQTAVVEPQLIIRASTAPPAQS